ncbi:MAG: ATP-binding protein [Nitrospiraceae bacterium]|nr:ATP-binding protein [Nitrospiraceae bacterium]
MKQGIFRRIFLLYGIILVLALAGTELFITGAVRTNEVKALHDNLAAQAQLIGRGISFKPGATLDALCRELKAETAARVTIIDRDGVVLGDSDHDSRTMDNHRTRIEVQQALFSGTGMTIRHSDTLNADMLYVAQNIAQNGAPRGIVRLSVSLREVDAAINRLRINIIAAVTLIAGLAALFLAWQVERIRRLTVQIRDFAASLARGELDRRLFLHRAGEFEEIAGGLNSMAGSLQGEISALRDEKAKFETALLGISDGVLLLNREGRVEAANTVFLDLFSITGAVVGKPFLEVVRNHALADLAAEAHLRHRAASGTIDVDAPKQLSLLATALPILPETAGEPRFHGTVVALHDITQLRKLEQVRKDFVANVSHELRTPVTAIQGFAETLLDGALEDKANARKFVETIRSNSERINRLVDDLMTISKIELGAIAVEKNDVAVEDAADAVLALLRDQAAKKGISLIVEIPHDFGMILADRDRLVQIMTNLVDNAIKFTDKGGVTLGAGEENGRSFLFVRDTGVGIPEKHLPRIGERFYRVDTARSRTMGGTGLGLAIVKHLVKAHGWEMKIESMQGKGTTVKVYVG